VARAIAASRLPVVSAVGHETDFTIADFVADLRAPTPSAAAELVVPARADLVERVSHARGKAVQAIRYRLAMFERRLRRQGIDRALGLLHRRVGRGLQRADEMDYRMRQAMRAALDERQRKRRSIEERLRRFDVRPRLSAGRRRLEAARMTIEQTLALRLARQRGALDRLSGKLSQLSPLLILERGYAIVSSASGIVKQPADAPAGSRIHVRVAKGEFDATVRKK
jgi:exodeoxyribonuclease VII large subunit